MKTYNQIINNLNFFAENHFQVGSWSSGFQPRLNDALENNSDLSILFFQIQSVANNSNTQDYRFRIYCLDAKQKDNYNTQDGLSDTLQILTDLRKWLIYNIENNNEQWSLTNTSTITPVNNYTNDLLVGWYMDITISSGLIESDCDIPWYSSTICETPYVESGYVSDGYTTCE